MGDLGTVRLEVSSVWERTRAVSHAEYKLLFTGFQLHAANFQLCIADLQLRDPNLRERLNKRHGRSILWEDGPRGCDALGWWGDGMGAR